MRWSLLEATPASQTIFDELLALTNASLVQLQRAGGLRESSTRSGAHINSCS